MNSVDGVAGAWDAIVSCFFIDTAHNVVEYLQVIARALKPGGVRPNSLSVCSMHIPAVNYTCQFPAWNSFVHLVLSSCCRRADSFNFAGVDKFGTITLSFCWIILPRRGNVCVWTFWISCLVLTHCLSLTFKHETAIFQILGLNWIDLIELWHAMAKQEMSLELSLEDVKKVASQLGLILKVWSSRWLSTLYKLIELFPALNFLSYIHSY